MLRKIRVRFECLLLHLGGIPSNVKYLKYHNELSDKRIAEHYGFLEESVTRFFKEIES